MISARDHQPAGECIKFSHVETVIEVGATRDGTNVQFWIKDNGPGIPANARERIFEKFARLKDKDRQGVWALAWRFAVLQYRHMAENLG